MSKLYRSQKDRLIAGVCAGLAEHFQLDTGLVRVAFIIATLFNGLGLLAYFIGVIIMPVAPDQSSADKSKESELVNNEEYEYQPPDEAKEEKKKTPRKSNEFMGFILVALGAFFLLRQLHVFDPFYDWFSYNFWDIILPSLFVFAGAALIYRNTRNKE